MDACTTIYHTRIRIEREFQSMSRQGPEYWQDNKPVFIYLIKGRLSHVKKSEGTLRPTATEYTDRGITMDIPYMIPLAHTGHTLAPESNVTMNRANKGTATDEPTTTSPSSLPRCLSYQSSDNGTSLINHTGSSYCNITHNLDKQIKNADQCSEKNQYIGEQLNEDHSNDLDMDEDMNVREDSSSDEFFHEVSHIGISSEPLQELNQHNAFYRGGTKPTRRAAPSWQLVAFAGPVAPGTTTFWRNAWRMRRGVTHRMHFVCQLCILTGMVLFGPRPSELKQTLQSVYTASLLRLATDSSQNIAHWLQVAHTLCVPHFTTADMNLVTQQRNNHSKHSRRHNKLKTTPA
jgi:hypothetical protein